MQRAFLKTLLLCLAWAGLVIIGTVVPLRQLVLQELVTQDWRFRARGLRPPLPEIVILDIDQQSNTSDTFSEEELAAYPDLALLGEYPFPRRLYARVIDRLMDAGARGVAFDQLFVTAHADDPLMRDAVARHAGRVILACNFTDHGEQLMESRPAMPPHLPIAAIQGFVNYSLDLDDRVRQLRGRTTAAQEAGVAPSPGEPEIPAFAGLCARLLTKRPMRLADGWIDYAGPTGTYPSRPIYQMFFPKTWERNLGRGEWFRDKLVLIGAKGSYHQDQHQTPFGRMDGVEIHANSIATWVRGTTLQRTPAWLDGVFIVLMGVLTALSLNLRIHPLLKLLPLLVVAAAYVGLAELVLVRAGLFLAVAAPLWTVAGGGVLGIAWQVAMEQIEKRRIRRTLDRYVSRQVADEILRHGGEYAQSLGGQRRAVTILFSDIRGFTSMSEHADPMALVQQLNEYLTAMVDIVLAYDGTLDKFIGDAIMAEFGAPLSRSHAEDAWRAVQTAAAMRARLTELQQAWAAQGKPILKIGIGLNHGEVIVGNVGSPQRMEYTVIGDAVNVASRVEGLTKELQTDILLTESVYELVRERIEARRLGEIGVKNRAQKLVVYSLDALRT